MASIRDWRPDSCRQFDEQFDGFVGNPILRVVEEQAFRFNRHFLAALRVGREQIAQVHGADFLY